MEFERRVGLTPRPVLARVPGIGLLNRTSEELGGKARGSTPPRASKTIRAGDVSDSIEVLQTSREGLNPSQSTKLRRSSIGFQSARLVNEMMRVQLSSPHPVFLWRSQAGKAPDC